jgi:hypothetical protein
MKKAFKGMGDKKDMELFRIRELLEQKSQGEGIPKVGYIGVGEINNVDDKIIAESIDDKRVDEKMECGWMKRCVPVSIRNSKFYHMASNVRPEWITALCGVLLCIFVAAGSLSRTEVVHVQADNTPRKSEAIPPNQTSGSSAGVLAWIVGAFFVSAFLGANYYLYQKAMKEKGVVEKDSALTIESKLAMLKEKSFWFDLPLYLGLLGTVMGFLIISFLESLAQVGRVVSYCSTIIGIFVSVGIHAKIASFRAKLLRERGAKDE